MGKITKKPNINRSLSFLLLKADDKVYVKLGSEKVSLPKFPNLLYIYFTRKNNNLLYLINEQLQKSNDKI